MDINKLIQQGYQLKMQITALNEQLHAINKQVAEQAIYRNDSKTGHINTPDIKVTVSQRENVKWDNEKLMSIKNYFGDKFDSFVKVEYKPDIRKIKASGGEIEKAFLWAKESTAGQPQVTYEMITEEDAV